MARGLLIVLEGCDRSGKTTQLTKLVDWLRNENNSSHKHFSDLLLFNFFFAEVVMMRFPDRTTQIGSMLDSYLRNKSDLSDQAVHLLFSANRWEKAGEIRNELSSGHHVVVDRYAYSGVAYTAAKGGEKTPGPFVVQSVFLRFVAGTVPQP